MDHHSAYLARAVAALTPQGHERVDELLEQLLAMGREVPDPEVVEAEALVGDAQHRDRGAHLALEDVAVPALRHRLLAGREARVVDLGAGLDHAGDGAGAAELVVGMRAEHQGAAVEWKQGGHL